MFAAGMAWSMGVSLESIRHGLRTFDMTFYQAPGRMNVFDEHGFKVILDYGHNPAAVDAMCTLVDGLGARGKRVCVLAAPGDRRDEDLRSIAARAARSFDHFVLREDDDTRGRAAGSISAILAQALRENAVGDAQIETRLSEVEATDHALGLCVPGDLLLLFGDDIKRTWKQIIYFGGRKPRDEVPTKPAYAAVPVEASPEALRVSDMALVRDERGVRVASEPEASD
jgi:cyanophycin synthetase